MAAGARAPGVARPAARTGWDAGGVCLAAAAFLVLCVLVLRAVRYLPEPDDYAYRALVVAMTDGHLFTLSGAQADALAVRLAPQLGGRRLGPGPGGGPVRWVRLPGVGQREGSGLPVPGGGVPGGRPDRLAPLLYAALACLGLDAGGGRWLGGSGGAAAAGLCCSCGAAILFGWRAYLPAFTEASLVAAGTGALLWAVLAAEASTRRRTWAGLAGFVALEAATFSRYTNTRGAGAARSSRCSWPGGGGPGGCPVARSPGGWGRPACPAPARRSSARSSTAARCGPAPGQGRSPSASPPWVPTCGICQLT